MKSILQLLVLLLCMECAESQITVPVIKASFGVDGELDANFKYSGFITSGSDDWYNRYAGGGIGVIDTTGAAAIVARYAVDPNFRKLPFYRTMRVPAYTTYLNRILIDAVFIRDYHGDDSTVFTTGASKNGQSPADWQCPISQSIPDKNDILDMFVHVRRGGSNITDSLWMMGGVSIENVTGDRYFDFEMYQTDIYYDRASQKFYGYGPDAGHTTWQFDASGNITVPGDVIFSADYGSSTLTSIEARIWINRASLSITPVGFDWTGTFDGAANGATYGYAGIRPKTAGNFYLGVESPSNAWAGPFALVREDNSIATSYLASQFMEFGVNLTKLGLDPVTLLGGNACGMPFRRVLVKTRASTSFDAALKDFVGPFDFFLAPRADAQADIPSFCGTVGVSTLTVNNPSSTSVYTWSTSDGHIVGSNVGSSITVDAPGTYIVTQQLQSGCSVYATDTVLITYDPNCTVLDNSVINFAGRLYNKQVQLNWTMAQNSDANYFVVERSTDGVHFTAVSKVDAETLKNAANSYSAVDGVDDLAQYPAVYYRLRIVSDEGGHTSFSKIIRFNIAGLIKQGISIMPNPVKDVAQLNISSSQDAPVQILIYDFAGKLVRTMRTNVQKGNSSINLSDFRGWVKGVYSVKAVVGNKVYVDRLVLTD